MPDCSSELRKHTWSANGELCRLDLPFYECYSFQICYSFPATYKSAFVGDAIRFALSRQVGKSFSVVSWFYVCISF